jgi:hypothetical protein
MVRATVQLDGSTVLTVKRLEVDDLPVVLSNELGRILRGARDVYAELDDTSRLPIEIGIEREG